jgi:hypothetical protein
MSEAVNEGPSEMAPFNLSPARPHHVKVGVMLAKPNCTVVFA